MDVGTASRKRAPGTVTGVVVVVSAAAGAFGQDAVIQDFRQNCASCHTIGGGRLTGPDLKNVEDRKDRAWLGRFVSDPLAMLSSGDAYALKLKEESHGAMMPGLPGMTQDRVGALLDLIAAESKLEKSQFAGVQISDRPLTPADVVRGESIFLGRTALANGGTACVSCHPVSGIGWLGGGRLAPDLTKIYERRQGRKGLVAWLSAPATPMMQATFRKHALEGEEILALVAFFEDRAGTAEETHSAGTLLFGLLGFGGTVGVLFLMGRLWRDRLRAVREPLTQSSRVELAR